ncbi:hypothetical protein [Streptomyces sp. NPDC005423]|uniref:hypothetical protein n=1 Tax=Streptomyces sp. NPDC005423 TaxID=3155343 RepID=UPI0033ADFB14
MTGVTAGLLAVLLTGCGAAGGDGRPAPRTTTSSGSSASPGTPGTPAQHPGYGAEFLGIGECGSFGTTSFTEVPCVSERAAARVVARHDGRAGAGPACPPTTDFVLRVSAQRSAANPDGGGAVRQGYACMRNLEPPHPGDPGGGGGPRTIVGDCVHRSGGGRVRETACDGSARPEPRYRVVRAVARRSDCPAATALYVQLGGGRPVGCAQPVKPVPRVRPVPRQDVSTGSSRR